MLYFDAGHKIGQHIRLFQKLYMEGKIHTCGSDVITELEHRSLCRRNETRTVNLEEQSEKSARAQSERTGNPVGDTADNVRRATGMKTFHNYFAFIT